MYSYVVLIKNTKHKNAKTKIQRNISHIYFIISSVAATFYDPFQMSSNLYKLSFFNVTKTPHWW